MDNPADTEQGPPKKRGTNYPPLIRIPADTEIGGTQDELGRLFQDLENSFIEFLHDDSHRTTSVPASIAAQHFEIRVRTAIQKAIAECVPERVADPIIDIAGGDGDRDDVYEAGIDIGRNQAIDELIANLRRKGLI